MAVWPGSGFLSSAFTSGLSGCVGVSAIGTSRRPDQCATLLSPHAVPVIPPARSHFMPSGAALPVEGFCVAVAGLVSGGVCWALMGALCSPHGLVEQTGQCVACVWV